MSTPTDFASLPLPAALLTNLADLGYSSMTAIQAQSLPVILKGMDVIAQAKTGSGKTAAFGIGLLSPLNPRYFGCQALVLCPTRELADQVAKEIRRLARAEGNIKVLTLCGGVPLGRRWVRWSMACILLSARQDVFRACTQRHFGFVRFEYFGA